MKKKAEVLASMTYTRDKIGQVEKVVETGFPMDPEYKYEYDAANRLTKSNGRSSITIRPTTSRKFPRRLTRMTKPARSRRRATRPSNTTKSASGSKKPLQADQPPPSPTTRRGT